MTFQQDGDGATANVGAYHDVGGDQLSGSVALSVSGERNMVQILMSREEINKRDSSQNRYTEAYGNGAHISNIGNDDVQTVNIDKDYSKVMMAVTGTTDDGIVKFIKALRRRYSVVPADVPSKVTKIWKAWYTAEGHHITLVMIPTFDESRHGIRDMDLLESVRNFLEPERNEKPELNGIIYVHDTSDSEVSPIAQKNLQILKVLCGVKALRNICLVPIVPGHISGKACKRIERPLTFLLPEARIFRYDGGWSAHSIISNFTDSLPMSMQIQEELLEGTRLEDTSAGKMIRDWSSLEMRIPTVLAVDFEEYLANVSAWARAALLAAGSLIVTYRILSWIL